MIRISNMEDLTKISDDPELWREAYGFLSVCAYEIREYGDEDDLIDHDFNLTLLNSGELEYLESLGEPEETALTRIECCGSVRMFRRLVFTTEIVLYEEK